MKGFKKVSQSKFDHFIIHYPTKLKILNFTITDPPRKVYRDSKKNWIGYVELYTDQSYEFFLKEDNEE